MTFKCDKCGKEFETRGKAEKHERICKQDPSIKSLPNDLTVHLSKGENVVYFSFISYTGGCGTTSNREDYWIAVTNKQILYKAKIFDKTNNSFTEKEGILPIDKVSFMEVNEITQNKGCSSAKYNELSIGTSGGNVCLPIPTKDKGVEIRKKFLEMQEHHGSRRKK